MEIYHSIEMAFWLSVAALGFAILFNVPKRTLIMVGVSAALGGSIKLLLIGFGANIIIASFLGAIFIGFLSIPVAHKLHAPPLIFSIPAVIPMIPGAFAYKAMIGIIKLATQINQEDYEMALNQATTNGIKACFILVALTAGVSFPMLITRQESAKKIKIGV